MTGLRFALRQPQRVLDRVDQRPVKFEQLPPRATGEDEPCQRSAGGSPTLGKLAAKLREGDRFAALYLGETGLQSGESVGVGENLGGLLQGLILVDRNQGCGWSSVAGHQDVIASIAVFPSGALNDGMLARRTWIALGGLDM